MGVPKHYVPLYLRAFLAHTLSSNQAMELQQKWVGKSSETVRGVARGT